MLVLLLPKGSLHQQLCAIFKLGVVPRGLRKEVGMLRHRHLGPCRCLLDRFLNNISDNYRQMFLKILINNPRMIRIDMFLKPSAAPMSCSKIKFLYNGKMQISQKRCDLR